MEMTDQDRSIHACAEALALEEVLEGDVARVLFMRVLARVMRGMTTDDVDAARALVASKRADTELRRAD